MRRALGLTDDTTAREPQSAAPRPQPDPRANGAPMIQRRDADRRPRRFVRDGEVPVVVVNGGLRDHGGDAPAPTNRLAATENALAAERSARERAERALAETQALTQQLRTQIAHAELAHREAVAVERGLRAEAEEAATKAVAEAGTARDALAAEREAREAAEIGRDAAEAELTALREAPPAPPQPVSAAPKPKRTPRARAEPTVEEPEPGSAAEPEPVKWWLPSYKSKLRKAW